MNTRQTREAEIAEAVGVLVRHGGMTEDKARETLRLLRELDICVVGSLRLASLESFAECITDYASASEGIAGWHENGEILPWDSLLESHRHVERELGRVAVV